MARVKMCKKLGTLLDLCVSSLRRGHANLLCIVPILTDDPRRESSLEAFWTNSLALTKLRVQARQVLGQLHSLTAIPRRMHRISFDLRS